MPDHIGKSKRKYTYKDSGVDIDKANSILSRMKDVISSTHESNVLSELSSFCGMFELDTSGYKDPVLTSSTDGVGTKLILAKQAGDYSNIGQDLVAMSVNDLICSGAKPLFFLDYIACGKVDEVKISAVIRSVAEACKYCNTALLGGETAEMPDMYGEDEIDLAGFAVGIVDRQDIFKPGDKPCPSCGRKLIPQTSRYGDVLKCIQNQKCNYIEDIFKLGDKPCPSCGRRLIPQTGKYGKVLQCLLNQNCNYIEDIFEPGDFQCPKCGRKLVERKKYNRFYGCSSYPKCDYISKIK